MDFPIELIKFASRGGGGSTDAVKYTEQTLTEEQKTQARKNQGLYWSESSGAVIEWDGDTTGRATIDAGGMLFYKVSDNVLSASDFASATMITSDGGSSKIPPEYIQELADGFVLASGIILSARAGVYDIGISITVSEDGVYSAMEEGMYVTRLEVIHETISKIDQKFIPDSIARADDVVKHYVFQQLTQWDKLAAAATEFQSGRATIVWGFYHIVDASVEDNSVFVRFADSPYLKRKYTNTDTGMVSVHVPDQYVYDEVWTDYIVFAHSGTHSDIGSIRLDDDDVVKMNGKFKFNNDGLILTASDNHAKIFKITVDSSGTLSATEVTLDS